jgi:signal transduction histidine kinase
MNVDMLRRNRMTAEAHSQSLDILHRELARLRSIVDDILDFSRLKDLHCSSFSIEHLVTEVREMLEGSLQLHSVTLDSDVTPCTLYADHDKIRDVLLILLGNALEALNGEGRIGLHGTIRSNADQYVLTIMDSGPGIHEPEKIFLPFYSTKEHGTGMGLPRGLKIAESHGGSLVLVSPQAGETTFAFTIPIWRSRHGAYPGNR